jgi:hypothetical protein
MKLANVLKTHEIGGRSYSFGRLTIGMGVEIESYLRTLPTELEKIESSGILKTVSQDVANSIVSDALQRHDVWPPDAISALCDRRFLTRSEFGMAFVKSALRQYNPGLSIDEIDKAASMATLADVLRIQAIAAGTDDIDPKEHAAPVEAVRAAN